MSDWLICHADSKEKEEYKLKAYILQSTIMARKNEGMRVNYEERHFKSEKGTNYCAAFYIHTYINILLVYHPKRTSSYPQRLKDAKVRLEKPTISQSVVFVPRAVVRNVQILVL